MADQIHKLAAQYFQLVELPNLALPPGSVLIQPAVQAALYERMFNENAVFPIPPASYRSRVLKQILSRIEDSITDPEEDEINDDLMECWSTLVSQPKPSALQQAQQLSLVKYTAPSSSVELSERTVTISESRGLILSGGTTGNRTWEAALHLGSFLVTDSGEALVRGKRVIELGAGTGFLSMVCARHLGVRSVVATDREPVLIDNIRHCVRYNLPEGQESIPVYPAIWDWGTPLETSGDLAGLPHDEDEGLKFDIALGADLIYDTDLVPLLIATVRDLFENYHIEQFIIAATLRNENTLRTFLNACETNSFAVETLPFESTSSEEQTGFFHSTSIPIRTYRISQLQ